MCLSPIFQQMISICQITLRNLGFELSNVATQNNSSKRSSEISTFDNRGESGGRDFVGLYTQCRKILKNFKKFEGRRFAEGLNFLHDGRKYKFRTGSNVNLNFRQSAPLIATFPVNPAALFLDFWDSGESTSPKFPANILRLGAGISLTPPLFLEATSEKFFDI